MARTQRTNSIAHLSALCGVFAGFVLQASPNAHAGDPATKVYINGKPAPVFFNDGDSFRVLGGAFKSTKARLAGYNTLESYGAVHSWGDWTAKEMFVLAKMATLHARKGVWHCETDGNTDTYGRALMWCPDLATELVRLGYAHAMTIDDNPGKPELLAAQREAIANKRGLWAHGVPDFVLTSLHSAEEDVDRRGTYNRLVSTKDAHSVKWKHSNRYSECTRVCHVRYDVNDADVDRVTQALRADSTAAAWVGKLSPKQLRKVVFDFAEYRHINRSVAHQHREALLQHLQRAYVATGTNKLAPQQSHESACMVHVDFKRRYGEGRASCLK